MNGIRLYYILPVFFIGMMLFPASEISAKDENTILYEQVANQLTTVHRLFNSSKPQEGALTHERKIAFYTLDAIFHNSQITPENYTLVRDYMSRRLMQVIADLNKPLPRDVSARVYKIYNCGVIVRTATVTVAFDLVRGTGLGAEDIGTCLGLKKRAVGYIDTDLMQQLVDKCDIMFVTHRHSDHYDPWVINSFAALKKPVIHSDEKIAEVYKNHECVQLARENKPWSRTFKAANGVSLETFIIPGHQSLAYDSSGNYLGWLHNNVYVITLPDGTVVAHSGDQQPDGNEAEENAGGVTDMQLFSEMYTTHRFPHVDIFCCIIWAKYLKEMVNAVNPKVLVPMHWAELGHEVPTRYTLGEWLLSGLSPQPYWMYTWGEWMDYKKNN